MSIVAEGAKVSWVGPAVEGYEVGDTGSLLALSSRTHAHVMWATGARSGTVDLVAIEDLSTGHVAARDDLLADSLEVGGLVTFSVRQVMDSEGPVGVLNSLVAQGHLSGFYSIAEEVLAQVTAKVRQDPSMRAVTAQLDEEEGESLVTLAATALIRDAFTNEED